MGPNLNLPVMMVRFNARLIAIILVMRKQMPDDDDLNAQDDFNDR